MCKDCHKVERRSFIISTAAALVSSGSQLHAAVAKQPLPPVDLNFISSKMELVARDKWTDIKPIAWKMRGNAKPDRITVHHAGGATNKDTHQNSVIHQLSNILQGHAKKDYGDIAYHLILDYSGRVWEGRSLAYEGAHVAENNESNIGIMMLGNFDKQSISKGQLGSLKQLVSLLRGEYGIKAHRIYGHRDLSPSACPGKNLYPYVEKLRG
ncbi:hypothetical protein BVX94_00280 [bacterium B17]|nr:hypothetical protein BVX94_00280 [bacterium B17]